MESRGRSKGERNVPVPWLTLLVFAEGFFRSFFGLIVSLLGFSRTLPLFSPRPPFNRSPALIDDCGIDCTVSVSTVMFRVPSGCLDFVDVNAGNEFFGVGVEIFGFCWLLLAWAKEGRGLSIPSLLFPPPSLSLSPVLVCFS